MKVVYIGTSSLEHITVSTLNKFIFEKYVVKTKRISSTFLKSWHGSFGCTSAWYLKYIYRIIVDGECKKRQWKLEKKPLKLILFCLVSHKLHLNTGIGILWMHSVFPASLKICPIPDPIASFINILATGQKTRLKTSKEKKISKETYLFHRDSFWLAHVLTRKTSKQYLFKTSVRTRSEFVWKYIYNLRLLVKTCRDATRFWAEIILYDFDPRENS